MVINFLGLKGLISIHFHVLIQSAVQYKISSNQLHYNDLAKSYCYLKSCESSVPYLQSLGPTPTILHSHTHNPLVLHLQSCICSPSVLHVPFPMDGTVVFNVHYFDLPNAMFFHFSIDLHAHDIQSFNQHMPTVCRKSFSGRTEYICTVHL